MYNNFAKYYDILMCDVNYAARADYVCALFEEFDKKPATLLDLACGTGGFSNEFAERGISVIGADISAEMLSLAQKKTLERNLGVFYICQSAQKLKLHGTVDGAVCLLDSLNHITDYGDFCEAFVNVSRFLKKGGMFIFDMNTEYKHEKVLADNTFVIEEDGVYCVWQNFYSKEEKITDITLDFFENTGNGYIRSGEDISERAYSDAEIVSALEKAGLKLEGVFGDMSRKPPAKTEQRKVFVARKP
ncbi:MAG: class I SAM-dependent methyltransferase [Clostridia bacterium]|nr:class I SAM-dependent methyltransferase [Clostridia bacterium]